MGREMVVVSIHSMHEAALFKPDIQMSDEDKVYNNYTDGEMKLQWRYKYRQEGVSQKWG